MSRPASAAIWISRRTLIHVETPEKHCTFIQNCEQAWWHERRIEIPVTLILTIITLRKCINLFRSAIP
ncbi:MAG TPA: hypothetical protein DCG12_13215 [Planctomycetaceae bacterium]|nr:hypothetical protein [Planctomycetaceae bacterium]